MSALGLPVFDKAVQDANIWLNELNETLDWDDKQRAYRLLRSVLHTVRDRLPINEASHLAAQLPMLIRGIYFEGWKPSRVPSNIRKKDEFVSKIEEAFVSDPNQNSEDCVRAVLQILSVHIPQGEIDDVKNGVPPGIRELWP